MAKNTNLQRVDGPLKISTNDKTMVIRLTYDPLELNMFIIETADGEMLAKDYNFAKREDACHSLKTTLETALRLGTEHNMIHHKFNRVTINKIMAALTRANGVLVDY